jgi:hypothetical protein
VQRRAISDVRSFDVTPESTFSAPELTPRRITK